MLLGSNCVCSNVLDMAECPTNPNPSYSCSKPTDARGLGIRASPSIYILAHTETRAGGRLVGTAILSNRSKTPNQKSKIQKKNSIN